MARKTFKFRLYPPASIQSDCRQPSMSVESCTGLQERIGAWKNRTPVNYYGQKNQLPDIKILRADCLKRVLSSFAGWQSTTQGRSPPQRLAPQTPWAPGKRRRSGCAHQTRGLLLLRLLQLFD